MSSSCYSPSRGSPNPARRQFGPGFASLSRLRCPSMRKPPEPLRRAVADCLSSSSATFQQGGPSSEASRTLRVAFQWQDHLASPATTNLAYSVILEHTTAERERSPAVVPRCVALLKRHLLRYKPSEEILLQIDRFCVHIIAEWDVNPNRTFSPRSRSLNQQNGAPTTSANLSPVPASSFASGALVKSLNYVRSLVALHIPKLSFQPVAFAGSHSISRHALPRLSSLLSRSFSNQLAPVNASGSSENKDVMPVSPSNLENLENVDGREDLEYIAIDVLKWRWLEGNQTPFLSTERDLDATLPETNTSNFLEVGAAALLVGDMETKINGLPRKCFGTADMPYIDQLLEPSPVTALTNSASACSHLKAITAAKRTKPGPREIWDDSHVSTFRPRARQLFQYRYYSEQQPLRLSPVEVHEVIAAVCSETSIPVANFMTVSSKLSNNGGKQPMDVAVSVLIKLVIDMYVQNSGTAAPLTLSMLEEMLKSPRTDCRTRAFDLILNLGVHAHLLEPIVSDDSSVIEEEYRRDTFFDSEAQVTSQGKIRVDSFKNIDVSSAIDDFEAWILDILYDALLLLVQIEEEDESVWASALSCLLYFVCDRGKISRHHLTGLDIRVIRSLILVGRKHSWAEVLHCKLNCILTNMFYQVPEEPDKDNPIAPKFLVDQFDLIGGVKFIYYEYFRAKSREERRNLFAVLFDYVLHRINEERIATGVSEYSDEEIQPLATLFALADAPEAFYISIKLGVEGIDEILGRSISAALASYSINERLNMLLENITEKFDTLIKSCTYLDKEFSYLKQITQSYKIFESIDDAVLRSGVGMTVKLSWVTLHSLLHSERFIYRIHGYIWLSDLLIDEIRKEKDSSTVSSIKILQQTIAHAGALEHSISSDVPLPICLLCGLLKSKNTFIRYGFLAILEKLLMRCKFLLDENELLQPSDIDSRQKHEDSRLEKANTMIDIMSSVLSLMAQMNETKRVNILKMCDILFSQLCLKVLPGTATPCVDGMQTSKVLTHTAGVKMNDSNLTVQDKWCLDEFMDENDSPYGYPNSSLSISKTTSMAALLLRGQAIVPRQLVARVPAALLYWPLIQLASAATDNIALGVAVGSKGRGNLPGATSDIRATLLLLLIGKCSADPAAFQEVGGDDFFKELLDDTDSRVAYYSSSFLLKRMMTEKPENYQNMLQKLIFRAQQSNNEKLLENPYLQMRGILQLSNDLGTGLI